jgi:hypothetical protein
VNINAALAQVSAMSQTVLKQMPAGITPPLILSFDASSVPILQLALSSDTLSETTLFDDASSFIRPRATICRLVVYNLDVGSYPTTDRGSADSSAIYNE